MKPGTHDRKSPFLLLGAIAICAAALLSAPLFAGSTSSDAVGEIRAPKSPLRRCVNLGNALDAPQEGDWTYVIKDDHIDSIAAAGFDSVRVPVRWDAHVGPEPDFAIEPEFLARVDHVVQRSLAQGLAVIIDVHHFDALMTDPDGQEAKFLSIWDQLARHYQGYSDQLIFELINEPRDALSGRRLEDVQAKGLAAVRRYSPNRWVIFSGDSYGHLAGVTTMRFPDDPRTIVTWHYYEPFSFSHQGASWMDDPYPPGREWGDASDLSELREYAKQVGRYAARADRPVFLGEFGVIRAVSSVSRAEWLKSVRSLAEGYGLGWCVWDFGGAFAIHDADTNAWKEGVLAALLEE